MSVYADAAALWRDQGWSGVLPLPSGRKGPPPVGFTGYEGRDPTDDEIERWRKQFRGGNIALRLPEGIVGIDVDLYKPGAREKYAEIIARCGELPPTWVSTSRTDGSGIRLYRVPVGIKLATKFGCGEVVQHHHRYAVVWPSVHPEDREYLLPSPDGEINEHPPAPEELPWLPESWIDELTERPGPWRRSVRATLADALTEMDSGGCRHDIAVRASLALVRFESLGRPGAAEALEKLGTTFRAAILDRSTPEEAETEWQGMVDGAREKVEATPARPSGPFGMVEQMVGDNPLLVVNGMLGVTLTAFLEETGDDPHFVFVGEHGSGRITAKQLGEQRYTRPAIHTATGTWPRRLRAPQYDEVLPLLDQVATVDDLGPTATLRGRGRANLRGYLACWPPVEGRDEFIDEQGLVHVVTTENPFIEHGRVHVVGSAFKSWIRTRHDERLAPVTFARMMKAIGCEQVGDDLWRVPDDLYGP